MKNQLCGRLYLYTICAREPPATAPHPRQPPPRHTRRLPASRPRCFARRLRGVGVGHRAGGTQWAAHRLRDPDAGAVVPGPVLLPQVEEELVNTAVGIHQVAQLRVHHPGRPEQPGVPRGPRGLLPPVLPGPRRPPPGAARPPRRVGPPRPGRHRLAFAGHLTVCLWQTGGCHCRGRRSGGEKARSRKPGPLNVPPQTHPLTPCRSKHPTPNRTARPGGGGGGGAFPPCPQRGAHGGQGGRGGPVQDTNHGWSREATGRGRPEGGQAGAAAAAAAAGGGAAGGGRRAPGNGGAEAEGGPGARAPARGPPGRRRGGETDPAGPACRKSACWSTSRRATCFTGPSCR